MHIIEVTGESEKALIKDEYTKIAKVYVDSISEALQNQVVQNLSNKYLEIELKSHNSMIGKSSVSIWAKTKYYLGELSDRHISTIKDEKVKEGLKEIKRKIVQNLTQVKPILEAYINIYPELYYDFIVGIDEFGIILYEKDKRIKEDINKIDDIEDIKRVIKEKHELLKIELNNLENLYNKIMSKQLKELEPHYYIDIEVKERKYTNNTVDKWGHNNTFKTKEEANKKVEKIYEVLEEL